MPAEKLGFLDGMNFIQGGVPPHPKDNRWKINNSTLENYFERVSLRSHPEDVLRLLEEQIGFDEENTGIDIGGGSKGVALRGLIEHGMLSRGLVTNYRKRSLWTRLTTGRTPNVDFVSGDILLHETWGKIIDWQQQTSPEGVSLVMHRPFGGMQNFTASFYKGALHRVLDMIRPGGAMFTQIPTDLRNLGEEWPEAIDGSLEDIGKSVITRPDVAEIIPSEETGNREGLQHAVILMSQPSNEHNT